LLAKNSPNILVLFWKNSYTLEVISKDSLAALRKENIWLIIQYSGALQDPLRHSATLTAFKNFGSGYPDQEFF